MKNALGAEVRNHNTFYSRTAETTDVWLTPPHIVEALGPFDLDPCSPINAAWRLAPKWLTEIDDGLAQDWQGRVFMNPPYGRATQHWLKKLADHGQGIALIFARVETQMFFETVWPRADAVFFFKGRIQFLTERRQKVGSPSAPSCLIAYGGGGGFCNRKQRLDRTACKIERLS
jgi:DNA N-6-adenine-methyltransferase (Dam)